MLHETASQTVGPFVHIGLVPVAAGLDIRHNEQWEVLAGAEARGEHIRVEGIVLDGVGAPVRDCVVEAWQANAAGKYHHSDDRQAAPVDPAFRGFGRAVADFATGAWWFDTVKPGPAPGRDGTPMAPHIVLTLLARGINIHLVTRLYFADEVEANDADPVLRLIEQPIRRETLLAQRSQRDGRIVYRLEIRLQGERETVFFDV